MGHLLHALHERQSLPDHAAALAHYSKEAALAERLIPVTPHKVLDYFSPSLHARLRVVYELDTEPMHYQCGTIPCDLEILEIWQGAWDCGSHLSDSALACVKAEALRRLT